MVTGAFRVMEGEARRYRHIWRASVFSGFLNPFLFLLAMGMGLGSLVDRQGGPAGIPYLSWLAPGLIVATAMQTGFAESTYPVLAAIRWIKSYDAALSTPVTVPELASGHLMWVTVRLVQVSVVYAAVASLMGAVEPSAILPLVVAATLTGLAFTIPTLWMTATIERDTRIASTLRFVITPMFLFSGTFFPIDRLPGGFRLLAYLTPLWHGVELARSWGLGLRPVISPVWHVTFLLAICGVSAVMAPRRLHRRLIT